MFAEIMDHPEDLPADFRDREERDGRAQVVCDYLAGMTDRYAQDVYRRLFHPYELM
jgi:dGTPase